ncbi:hypothetical protein PSPO01_05537 [Paraphaeosphaeria sporulosa]
MLNPNAASPKRMDRDLASSTFETPNTRHLAPSGPSAVCHSPAQGLARPQSVAWASYGVQRILERLLSPLTPRRSQHREALMRGKTLTMTRVALPSFGDGLGNCSSCQPSSSRHAELPSTGNRDAIERGVHRGCVA